MTDKEKPLTEQEEEILNSLDSGLRFNVTTPGDWMIRINRKDGKILLVRVR